MIRVHAPSNIALIKYMGKEPHGRNIPTNSSLSLTLNRLCTRLELVQSTSGSRDEVLSKNVALEGAGLERIVKHLDRMRSHRELLKSHTGLGFSATQRFKIKTENTFPSSAGIASSASGFAALTTAAAFGMCEQPQKFLEQFEREWSIKKLLASLAREGSGSACRSFGGPWVKWTGEEIETLHGPLGGWVDFVLVVDEAQKAVSSSEAHRHVRSSPLWLGRPKRADDRLTYLERALQEGDVQKMAQIAWSEMWEMHSLFHTSERPFTYLKPETVAILQTLESSVWTETRGGADVPVVTLDAGPNPHVLVQARFRDQWRVRLEKILSESTEGRGKLLEDESGQGVKVFLE